ncbi:MAG: hypothetical protein RLZZ299_608 [Pseudomonadota bacterium]
MYTTSTVAAHGVALHTVGTVLGVSLYLTLLLAVLWNLPWRACEREQLEAAMRGERLAIPPRPSVTQALARFAVRVPTLARVARAVGA